MGRKFLWHIIVKLNEFFLTRVSIKLNIFILLSKIAMHFQDRGGSVCFLAHTVITLKIFACQKNFYQKFHLKKNFLEICNKMYLPFWNNLAFIPLGWSEGCQFLHLQIVSWKTLNIYIFFSFFDLRCLSLKYLTSSISSLPPFSLAGLGSCSQKCYFSFSLG